MLSAQIANNLEDWTAETLADGLEPRLIEIGINIECRPDESGLSCLEGEYNDEPAEPVAQIVHRVIGGIRFVSYQR